MHRIALLGLVSNQGSGNLTVVWSDVCVDKPGLATVATQIRKHDLKLTYKL